MSSKQYCLVLELHKSASQTVIQYKPWMTEVIEAQCNETAMEETRDQLYKLTSGGTGAIPELGLEEGFQLELDDNRSSSWKAEPQGHNIVEPTHTTVGLPPFNRYPQLVSPFRILYPPLL